MSALPGGERAADRDAVGSPGGPAEGLPAVHGGRAHPQPGADVQSAADRRRPGGAQGTRRDSAPPVDGDA